MNKVIHPCSLLALCILGIVVLTCCSKRKSDDDKPVGKVKVEVGLSISSHNVYNDLKAASTGDFKVVIYNTNNEIAASYDKASEMPNEIELQEGTYHAVASYGENLPASFENPYYYGISTDFIVQGGKTTNTSITCYIANILLSVVFSDNVKSSFSDYSAIVSNNTGSITFSKTETRLGYFNAGPLKIKATLLFTDGLGQLQTKNLEGTIDNPEPRKHYEVHIDATREEGSAGINLIADETVETEIVNIIEAESFGQINYGDLIITEIMFNPTALDDAVGEWIEVYNTSDSTINLKDLVIRRVSGSKHTISKDVILKAHKYAVLARTDTATLNPEYVYASISLTNTSDEIIINKYGTDGTDGEMICSVAYSTALGFPSSVSGASIQLGLSAHDVESAKQGINWCKSSTPFITGDLGTPGSANSSCN